MRDSSLRLVDRRNTRPVEYAMLAVVVALGAIDALAILGHLLQGMFGSIGVAISH